MDADNAISSLIAAIHSAAYSDFPDIHYKTMTEKSWKAKNDGKPYEHLQENRTRRPRPDEVECVAHFKQTWSNTAIGHNGHGGIAGQAYTSAYTTVLVERTQRTYYVYFGGMLAYSIMEPNDLFWEDAQARSMEGQRGAWKYRKDLSCGPEVSKEVEERIMKGRAAATP